MNKHALSIENNTKPGEFYTLSPYDDMLIVGEDQFVKLLTFDAVSDDNPKLFERIDNVLSKLFDREYTWVETKGDYGHYIYDVDVTANSINLTQSGNTPGFIYGVRTAFIITTHDHVSVDQNKVLPTNEKSTLKCSSRVSIKNTNTNDVITITCQDNSSITYDPEYKVLFIDNYFEETTGSFTNTVHIILAN